MARLYAVADPLVEPRRWSCGHGSFIIAADCDRSILFQQIRNDKLTRASLTLAVLLTLVFAVAGAIVRPSMYSDSAVGFHTWDTMRDGAGFNRLVQPLAANIALDEAGFLTWWTPGQYIFAGLLEMAGIDLGSAIVLVVMVCSLLGLWGWYALYRAFGFSARTSAISLAIIACGRNFGLPFGVYNGGEILLFAGVPWAYLLIWRLRDLPWRILPLFVLTTAGVVFLKLSGIIYMAAALSACVPSAGGPWLGRDTVRKAVVAGVTLIVTALVFYFAWMSRGATAAGVATGTDWSIFGGVAAFTLSSIWTGIFGFGGLIDYAFFHPGRELLSTREVIDHLLLLPAAAATIFMWWRLRTGHADYARFALLTAAAVAVVFIAALMQGAAVSLEERHLRPLSMLLLVGMVEAFLGTGRRPVRMLFVGMAGLSIAYGLAAYVFHARTNLRDALGARGVRLHIVTGPALSYLASVDRPDTDGTQPVIYVPAPEAALELRHARIIVAHADFESEELLANRAYHGKVRRLYVLLQTALVDSGKAEIILRSFADYPRDGWKKTTLGEFVVFSSTP